MVVAGGEGLSIGYTAQPVLEQAKALYRYGPDVEVSDQLFI